MHALHFNRLIVMSINFTVFFLFCLIPATWALSFNLSSITGSDSIHLNITGDAYVSDQGILVTPNSSGGKAGRATFLEPLHLWDEASRNMTDFSTHFSLLIDSNGTLQPNYGDGLAFFLAPLGSSIKSWAYGGGLGLGNAGAQVNSSSLEAFVAVELDTFFNADYDPTYAPHVGIDINSMRSVATAKWENNISHGVVNDVWINYNASSKMLRVDFTGHTSNGTQQGSLSYEVDLRDHLPEYVNIGFSAATGLSFEKHIVISWVFSSSLQFNVGKDVEKKKKMVILVIVCLCVGLPILLLFMIALLCIWKKRKAALRGGDDDDASMDEELIKGSGPRKFSYEELFSATNGFTEKLGEGGFGEVYKGVLREEETDVEVAVKRVCEGSTQGRKEYESEVKIISQVRHGNVVKLKGWCHRRRQLLLVYEFMPNGSLDSHLFREDPPLSWDKRFKIARGVASALLYLHEELEQYVVHRDIKASNIMLDSEFNAKLGDFGLARVVDRGEEAKTTMPAGTPGYMDFEHLSSGRASKANDVHGFGIVLLELASGRRAVANQEALVVRVRQLDGAGQLLDAADTRLGLLSESDAPKVHRLLAVGLRCAHPDTQLRPSITQAIQDLSDQI